MNVKHVLMLLFIIFIFVPVVLKSTGLKIEGFCTDDIYKMIEQKMNNVQYEKHISQFYNGIAIYN
jgi:hypothetical protein